MSSKKAEIGEGISKILRVCKCKNPEFKALSKDVIQFLKKQQVKCRLCKSEFTMKDTEEHYSFCAPLQNVISPQVQPGA